MLDAAGAVELGVGGALVGGQGAGDGDAVGDGGGRWRFMGVGLRFGWAVFDIDTFWFIGLASQMDLKATSSASLRDRRFSSPWNPLDFFIVKTISEIAIVVKKLENY